MTIAALLYIVWNNGTLQPAMGYWLKSFNSHPPPVPGKSFTVPQINNCECSFRLSHPSTSLHITDRSIVPLPTTGIFIGVALTWGWLSDGPCRGARWPFIYIGAAITVWRHCLSSAHFIARWLHIFFRLAQLVFGVLMLEFPMYSNIKGRMIIYWLSDIGVSTTKYGFNEQVRLIEFFRWAPDP